MRNEFTKAVLGLTCGVTPAFFSAAQPARALDTAVFAGRDIRMDGATKIAGAPGFAGGNVAGTELLAFTSDSLYLGGAFTFVSGPVKITGDLTTGGNVSGLDFAGSFITGSVFSGGKVLAGAIDIDGDIVASGAVVQTSSLSTIGGNITSGATVQIEGTVGDPVLMTNGVVTYNTGFELGTFASVNQLVQGGPVAPPIINTPALPTPNAIVPNANDINLANNQDITLAPGTYGTLTYNSSNEVTLTAGRYIFDDIVSTFALNRLAFDTSAGPIEVLVEGDLVFTDLVQVINGEPIFTAGNPDPADAADIWLEATGNITLSDDIFATVYAPNGDITANTFATVTGSLIAGRDVLVPGSLDVTYVRTNVPEPGSAALLGLAAAGLLRRRRSV